MGRSIVDVGDLGCDRCVMNEVSTYGEGLHEFDKDPTDELVL